MSEPHSAQSDPSRSVSGEAAERFRQMLHHCPLATHIYRLAEDGRLVFSSANPAADRTLRVDHRQFFGKPLEAAFPSVAGTAIPAQFLRIAAEGGHWTAPEFAYQDSRISGVFEVYAYQIAPGAVAVTFSDITVRRQAESALKQNEASLRAIAGQMPCVFWTTDLSLRFTSSNGAGLKNLGLMPGQVVGLLVEEYFEGQADRAKVLHSHRRACAGETSSYETSAFGRKYMTYVEPLRGSQGAIIGALGVAFDITERKRAQEALQQSEAQLRSIGNQIPGAIWTTDTNLHFTSFYAAERKDLSLKPTHVVGLLLEDFFTSSQERDLSVSAHRRALSGETVVYDSTVYDRQYFNYLEPLRDGAGGITGVLGIALDITAQKQAEDTLRVSEENYRRLLEQAPDGIFVTDSQGRFLLANSRMREMLGYTEEEIARLTVFDTYVPEEHDIARQRIAQLQRGERLRVERRMRRKDGTCFPVESSSARRVDGAMQAIIRDITERRQAEAALHASEEKYHRFFEENLAGYYLMTPSGKLLECNPAFARLFGFASLEEALISGVASLYPAPEALAEFVELVRGRRRVEQHVRELRDKNGRGIRVLENAVGVFRENGELLEIHGYLIDDSERWKAEEQLRQVQKLDAVGRLAGGVAHDFNNLLAVINGYGDLALKKTDASQPIHADLREIRRAGEKAAELVRQLLAFSRQQPAQVQALNLNSVIADSVRMIERLIGEDITLRTRLEPSLAPVRADSAQINQVLINLAVNARDAMPSGGTLTIETADVQVDAAFASAHGGIAPGPYILLTVSDSGLGMDAQTLGHAFEPFFTTKGPGRGVGLGLSTVYGIVSQNHGWIGMDSELGRGTTVRIYWPRTELETEPAASTPPVPVFSVGAETILLVEDQSQVRALARDVLAACGYQVLSCADGAQALQLAGDHPGPIDLLLTDVVMPGLSGPELAEQLRGSRPSMKVLYISGYSGDAILQRGIREPGPACLPKPFSADGLANKVREVLGPLARPLP